VPVPVPEPSPKPVKIPSPNPSPNPFSVKAPQPDQIPLPMDMPVPEPGTKQPETPLPVPQPATKQVPKAAPVPEPVIVNVPAPSTNEPSPSTVPEPTAQDPAPAPAPGMKRSTEQAPAPDAMNSTLNGTSPSPAPGSLNSTEPALNNSTEPAINNSTEPAINNSTEPAINNSTGPVINNPTEPAPSPALNPTLNATTNFTSRWVHVFFTPNTFNVTILSNQTDIYYIKDGPCMPIIDYWKNLTLGCPCNGTWNNTGYYNSSTKSFEGGRQITPSLCPNNTCQEAFFLNDTITYANLRLNITTFVGNGTVANKTVEITKMSPFKDVGYSYGAKDIIAVFVLSNENNTVSFPIVPVVTKPQMNETNYKAGSMSLPVTSIVTVMFALLLIMYESTQ
jgi:hypothetical protein